MERTSSSQVKPVQVRQLSYEKSKKDFKVKKLLLYWLQLA